ncbi:Peptidase family S41 [Ceratocystis platani]|uniref:Peptidase family S41 n=1 Tax=Ceratocystis fimbriata f. sp. platani TaxID=88771 RepID=A0A0F8DFT9_CERFI|nr:Peptidase family S41 [Ceratocystis platani]
MKLLQSSLLSLFLALPLAHALPLDTPATTNTPTPASDSNSNACASIHSITVSQLTSAPSATPSVPASLAAYCLKSTPNRPDPAVKLVKSLSAYIDYQSSLPWLKNPPDSYKMAPVDLAGEIAGLEGRVTAGEFASEYDFQLEIIKIMTKARDGHLAFRGDIFRVFSFRNNLVEDLVSVSSDGRSLPKIYHLADLQADAANAKEVTRINGVSIGDYLTQVSMEFVSYQDADAIWNSQFPTYANSQAKSLLASSLAYLSAEVTLTYSDGSSRKSESYALFKEMIDFSQIKSGDDLYDKVCNPKDKAAAKSRDVSSLDHMFVHDLPREVEKVVQVRRVKGGSSQFGKRDLPGDLQDSKYVRYIPNKVTQWIQKISNAPGFGHADTLEIQLAPALAIDVLAYPTPIVGDSKLNVTGGYFLDDQGYDDVAVLSVSSFTTTATDAITYLNSLQATLGSFFDTARKSNKKRLVIDLLANGGGYVLAGQELYAHLFPNTAATPIVNMGLSDSMELLGKSIGNVDLSDEAAKGMSQAQLQAAQAIVSSTIAQNLRPTDGNLQTPEGDKIADINQLLTPVMLGGEKFTAYFTAPQDKPNNVFNITGTGNKANPDATAPFSPENIVLLTDGTCGSTCTLFASLMVQHGVKTVVVGGKPENGKQQVIGGVEGAQIFTFNELSSLASAVLTLTDGKTDTAAPASTSGTAPIAQVLSEASSASIIQRDEAAANAKLQTLAEGYALQRALDPTTAGSVNGKNSFNQNDLNTPLQFLDDPADCRLFFTLDSIRDPTSMWKRAVDGAWNNPTGVCVEGSL